MSAANAIGTGAVVITANADALQSGLQQAGTKVENWAGAVSKKAESHAGGEGEGGGGLIGRILGMAKAHPIVTAALASFSLAAGGVHEIVDSIKELAAVGKTAGSLGIDSGQYMGIAEGLKRVGIEGDAVPGVFAKLGKNVAESSPALATLGLNAKQLIQLPLDKQMMRVADAIKELPKGAQQSAAAMEVFGKSGYQLLPFLQKGSEGIQEFIDHEKKLGVALSQGDMDKISSAKAALPKIGAVFEGFWNKIVVAAAPVVELVANKLTAAFEAVSPILGVVAGFVDGAFFVIGAAIEVAIELVEDFLSSIGLLGEGTTNWEELTKDAGHLAIDIFGAVGVVASALWEVIKVGAGVMAYVASAMVDNFGLLVDVFEEIIKLAKELPEELRPDWLDGLIAGTEDFSKTIHKTADEMRSWGDAKFDDAGNSFNRTVDWAGGLHGKFDEKNKKKEKEKPVAEAITEAIAAPKFAAAVQANSQDLYRISAQGQFAGLLDAKDPAAVQKQQLTESKKQTDHLAKIEALLGDSSSEDEEI